MTRAPGRCAFASPSMSRLCSTTSPPLEVSGAVPEPRIVVTMTRPQAEALERWLHALHDDLQYDDDRRLTCLLCISGVAVAIMLSEER
jgi:hypothetical protein